MVYSQIVSSVAEEEKKREKQEICGEIRAFTTLLSHPPPPPSFTCSINIQPALITPDSVLEGNKMAAESDEEHFVPALIVVDMQEDFCPPVSEELSQTNPSPKARD